MASRFPLAVDDRRVVLVHHDALRPAQVAQDGVLEFEPDFLRDHLSTREDGDIPQHFLTAIAKARRLDPADLERAAELVDHERRERLTLDVLGDDEEGRPACATFSSTGRRSFIDDTFLSWIRTSASSSTASIFSGSLMK